MNILYIAYSCSPYYGSEDKIGWNVPVESAKINRVFVITKEEHRHDIENYLKKYKIENITFYYVDIHPLYKKIYKGAIYSGRLNVWHKKACIVAKNICEQERIDLIHQITPVEFRSIGNYYSIPNIKFVCGPLGGGEFLPRGLKAYAKKNILLEFIRTILNTWFYFRHKMTKKLKRCDYLLFANRETKDYLCKLFEGSSYELFSDSGVDSSEFQIRKIQPNNENKCLVFLVAGRIIYRKGHRFLLDALKQLPEDLEYQCRIVGDGPELNQLKIQCQNYGLGNKVVFTGRIPYTKMVEEYNNADVFIMPSIRETTGVVLLEAMSKGLPVITMDKFGGSTLLDNETGWLFGGTSKETYIENLKNAIQYCIFNPQEVTRRGENALNKAKQYTWENKMKFYQSKYEEVLSIQKD